MDSSISNESLLKDQSSSKSFRRKLRFFIPLIVIFIFIITGMISVFAILKHQIDSQSLALNPTRAIQRVCYFSPGSFFQHSSHIIDISQLSITKPPFSDPDLCIESISLLHVNSSSKTNPSKIFALSLVAAINQLNEITSSTKALLPKFKNLKYEAAMKNCSDSLNHSLTHLIRSLTVIGVDPDMNSLRNKKMVGDMKSWIKVAESDIGSCLNSFTDERRFGSWIGEREFLSHVNMANTGRAYVSNSFVILENIDNIFDMFYPKISYFLSDIDWFTCLVFVSPQFLFVAALFGALFRIHR